MNTVKQEAYFKGLQSCGIEHVGNLLTFLAGALKDLNRADLETFIREVEDLRRKFSVLKPPKWVKSLHRLMAAVMGSLQTVAGCIRCYLDTGDPACLAGCSTEAQRLRELADEVTAESVRLWGPNFKEGLQ